MIKQDSRRSTSPVASVDPRRLQVRFAGGNAQAYLVGHVFGLERSRQWCRPSKILVGRTQSASSKVSGPVCCSPLPSRSVPSWTQCVPSESFLSLSPRGLTRLLRPKCPSGARCSSSSRFLGTLPRPAKIQATVPTAKEKGQAPARRCLGFSS